MHQTPGHMAGDALFYYLGDLQQVFVYLYSICQNKNATKAAVRLPSLNAWKVF